VVEQEWRRARFVSEAEEKPAQTVVEQAIAFGVVARVGGTILHASLVVEVATVTIA